MISTVKPQLGHILRQVKSLLAPGLLTLATSLTLVGCTPTNEKVVTQSLTNQISGTKISKVLDTQISKVLDTEIFKVSNTKIAQASKTPGIKTNVLRMGYQQAGDLVRASASHYFILRALEEVGLKYSDIKVQSLPNVEAASAFLQGRIPVWVTGDPHLARAEKEGKVRILRNATGINSPGGYYVGIKQFAIDNPALLKIVIEEIDKIQKWAQAHPKETAELTAQYQKLPPDVMDLVIRRRTYGLRAISPALIKDQQRVADYFYKNGVIPKQVNVKEATLTPQQYAAITPTTISQK
jgi:hypothetical protein